MRRQIIGFNLFTVSVIVGALSLLALPRPANAQSSLQPSASSLQPQTGQSQAPNSNLNQTGGVQNNSGAQSFLNRSGLRPLGVVSDPNQSSPSAVAAPSQTIKTDITTKENINWLPFIAIGSLIIAVIGFTLLWRSDRKIEDPAIIQEVPASSEPAVKRVKKVKKSRKKRRKPNQR